MIYSSGEIAFICFKQTKPKVISAIEKDEETDRGYSHGHATPNNFKLHQSLWVSF